MSTCPTCGTEVTVWADRSGGVTVNFRCPNARCKAGKAPWDTPEPNAVREDGVDRCPCGCKYWEGDRCIDCGGTVPEPDNSPEAVAARKAMFGGFGWGTS